MITKEIHLLDKVSNGDGTSKMIAELAVYHDGIFNHHDSRSLFTFPDTMTDQDIIDYLIANDYSRYF